MLERKPMDYIDTHCHVDMVMQRLKLEHFDQLQELFPRNFEKVIHIACDEKAIDFAEAIILDQTKVYCGIGIHPHDAEDYRDELHQRITRLMNQPKVLAWGEIGLDYHYDYSPRDIQKSVFERQLTQALQLEMPIIIHTREADEDTLDILSRHLQKESKVHIHCFTGSAEFAQKLLALPGQIFFGFTGVITFKNAEEIRASVRLIPINQILLETDAPFMAPLPHRGKPAHSGMIPFIAEKIAEIKAINTDQIYKQCRLNTQIMYGV